MKTILFIILSIFFVACTSERKLIRELSAQYKYSVWDGNMSSVYYTNEIEYVYGGVRFVDHLGISRTCSEYTLEENAME